MVYLKEIIYRRGGEREMTEEQDCEEQEKFEKEVDLFTEIVWDFTLCSEDYYKAFTEMCDRYDNWSTIPYSVYCFLLDEEYPAEEYYLQMLIELYNRRAVGKDFLDTLQRTLELGCNNRYIAQSREQIKDYIHDGYIIAYRGEFASEKRNNLDYKESVSYSLNYNTAKHFATRFREVLELTKSEVYTVKVPIEDVVGSHEREDEVICIPIKLGGKMEVIKVESML